MDSTAQAWNEHEEQLSHHDGTKLPGTLPVEDPFFEDPDPGFGGGSKLPGTVPLCG